MVGFLIMGAVVAVGGYCYYKKKKRTKQVSAYGASTEKERMSLVGDTGYSSEEAYERSIQNV